MGSEHGLGEDKIRALPDYRTSPLYSERERAALQYADAITKSDADVSDALFARLKAHFDEDQLVELTAVIAWENCSSKFNRALRVESQELWKAGGSA